MGSRRGAESQRTHTTALSLKSQVENIGVAATAFCW